jgi:uncharacterized protein (DUF3820 family)
LFSNNQVSLHLLNGVKQIRPNPKSQISNQMSPDPELLKSIVTTQMPFGKYKGTLLCDLPDFYLEWFARQGFPKGKLGMQLHTVHEIKLNGLHEILVKLKQMR